MSYRFALNDGVQAPISRLFVATNHETYIGVVAYLSTRHQRYPYSA